MRFPYLAKNFSNVQKNFEYLQGILTNKIAGQIQTTGATLQGTGFVAVRNSAGNYTITFSRPYRTVPIVTILPSGGVPLIPRLLVNTNVTVQIALETPAGVQTDAAFDFIAESP